MLITPWLSHNNNDSFLYNNNPKPKMAEKARNYRNELFIQEINDSVSKTNPSMLFYNVTLVSEILSDSVEIFGEGNGISTGVFLKIVHTFTGKLDRFKANKINLEDKQEVFSNLCLYPLISYVTSIIDDSGAEKINSVAELDDPEIQYKLFRNSWNMIHVAMRNIGCTFWRHTENDNNFVRVAIRPNYRGISDLLNAKSPVYSHAMALAMQALDCAPTRNDSMGLKEAEQMTVYFDIPDPRYPGIYVYVPENVTRAVKMKSMYTAKELLSNLNLLDVTWVEPRVFNSDEYNVVLRRAMMSLPSEEDAGNESWVNMIHLRMVARAIASDYQKSALINLAEEIELICKVYDNNNLPGIQVNVKKLKNPFKQQFEGLQERLDVSLQTLQYNIVEWYKHSERVGNSFKATGFLPEYRISISDNAYETVVKLTDMSMSENIPSRSVTVSLQKSEAVINYVIEHLTKSGVIDS